MIEGIAIAGWFLAAVEFAALVSCVGLMREVTRRIKEDARGIR